MALKETPWFYHPVREQTRLSVEEARHALSSLRLEAGERVMLTDGRGGIADAQVEQVRKGEVSLRIGEWMQQTGGSKDLMLVVGRMHNAERMEWLVEKLQELGVRRIIVADMDRCGKGSTNLERWQRIAVSALKQSHQAWLCEVLGAKSIEEALAACKGKGVFGYIPPYSETESTGLIVHKDAAFAVIGPEADFSEREVNLMLAAGLVPVSLGATRLRTETAAMVAATVLLLG